MYFHGARFSNYEAWLSDPTHIKPSAQVVWPVVGQEILNGDVGGGFQGIQITSGFFQLWRASGITSELQLYTTAIGGLVMAAAMFFAGWFHYHKAAPKLEWFQNVESMLNHHLAGLLGLGSLAWAGHQIHVSLPVNKLLDAGVDPKEIPLPHDLLLNRAIMADLYPSFAKGIAPFFTLNWSEYSDFLTFKGGSGFRPLPVCKFGLKNLSKWRKPLNPKKGNAIPSATQNFNGSLFPNKIYITDLSGNQRHLNMPEDLPGSIEGTPLSIVDNSSNLVDSSLAKLATNSKVLPSRWFTYSFDAWNSI